MKIEKPPYFEELEIENYLESILDKNVKLFFQEVDKRYFYWTEIKHRPNQPYASPQQTWKMLKAHRLVQAKQLFLGNHPFHFCVTSFIQQDLHNFDLKLIGGLYKDSISTQEQQEYLKSSLLEEAIASSQIEGAATTTDVAKEMIKSGRKPRNESEQMIINNFRAIQEIENRLDEDMSVNLILDIHEIMTVKTGAAKYAGEFRNHPIYVKDHIDGEIAFTAPDSSEINPLIEDLLNFINREDEFYHPIIKASILHFMIGYIHPFGDGNGRTARALFYWYLIKKGYSLLKHISISRAILDSRTSYDKAFLKTENDNNDLTYFIMYSMKSLRVALQSLVTYRDKKREEKQKAAEISYELTLKGFNKRQADLLGYLSVKPEATVTVPIYSERNGIVRQTATRDLAELVKKGMLRKQKVGKTVVYELVDNT